MAGFKNLFRKVVLKTITLFIVNQVGGRTLLPIPRAMGYDSHMFRLLRVDVCIRAWRIFLNFAAWCVNID